MLIRNAKISDSREILKLGNSVKEFQVSEKTVIFWPKDSLLRIIKNKNDIVLVAEEGKNIAGFIIVNYNPNLGKAIIENIFVKEEFRGKNIGEVLLESAIKQLSKLKCKYVCTFIKSKDAKIIGWYGKRGFNRGIDCVWLEKRLSGSFKRKPTF